MYIRKVLYNIVNTIPFFSNKPTTVAEINRHFLNTNTTSHIHTHTQTRPYYPLIQSSKTSNLPTHTKTNDSCFVQINQLQTHKLTAAFYKLSRPPTQTHTTIYTVLLLHHSTPSLHYGVILLPCLSLPSDLHRTILTHTPKLVTTT